ncbi:Ankyrin repeat-containing protein, partial [Brazilian cedratvirus IHUMI]
LSLEGEISFARASFAEACVQGESRYIIDYLLSQGYVERSSLAYAACKYNYLDLVKEFYEGEFQLHGFCCSAVEGDALEVLAWIVEQDHRYCSSILYQAMHNHRTKVLRWLPRRQLRKLTRKGLFVAACSAPDMDMFNFLLEKNYLPKQVESVSLKLAQSPHVDMLRILVKEKGWVLDEDMFDAALERGCEQMLSCLLELGCLHADIQELYHTVGEDNVLWLIKNFPLTEQGMLEICTEGPEHVLYHLLKEGCLPESFKGNPDITLVALQETHARVVQEYLQQGYTFYDDVSLRVDGPVSLSWLIENEIGLCPALFYRLVNDAEEELVEKLAEVIDPPDDLFDHIQSLIYDKDIRGKGHTRKVAKLESIAKFIRDW